MLKWPDAPTVVQALKKWAEKLVKSRPDVLRIGYFGSYARGDWGVGSDLDLLMVVEQSETPFEMRAAQWDTLALPVPADVLTYTWEEWQRLKKTRKFFRVLAQEVVWIYQRTAKDSP